MHITETLTENINVQVAEFNRKGQKVEDEEGIKNKVRKKSFFLPVPPHVHIDLVVPPPSCGRSVTDF
jgi:hypothetical protein